MTGRCPTCKKSVSVYTIKYGDLFSTDSPFEVCYKHTVKHWIIFNRTCEGSESRPEIIWTTDYIAEA